MFGLARKGLITRSRWREKNESPHDAQDARKQASFWGAEQSHCPQDAQSTTPSTVADQPESPNLPARQGFDWGRGEAERRISVLPLS